MGLDIHSASRFVVMVTILYGSCIFNRQQIVFINDFSVSGVKAKMVPHIPSHIVWCYDYLQ